MRIVLFKGMESLFKYDHIHNSTRASLLQLYEQTTTMSVFLFKLITHVYKRHLRDQRSRPLVVIRETAALNPAAWTRRLTRSPTQICPFPFFSQVRIPHDDHDLHDRHVLPAGHPHRTRLEHVIHAKRHLARCDSPDGAIR